MGAPHVEDRVVERGFQKAFAMVDVTVVSRCHQTPMAWYPTGQS